MVDEKSIEELKALWAEYDGTQDLPFDRTGQIESLFIHAIPSLISRLEASEARAERLAVALAEIARQSPADEKYSTWGNDYLWAIKLARAALNLEPEVKE